MSLHPAKDTVWATSVLKRVLPDLAQVPDCFRRCTVEGGFDAVCVQCDKAFMMIVFYVDDILM